MKTIAVNKYKESYDIYIGRGSIWGNPFIIGKDGTREEVIQKYEELLYNLIQEKKVDLTPLKGKKLGCFCKPKACHGDILADKVNKL